MCDYTEGTQSQPTQSNLGDALHDLTVKQQEEAASRAKYAEDTKETLGIGRINAASGYGEWFQPSDPLARPISIADLEIQVGALSKQLNRTHSLLILMRAHNLSGAETLEMLALCRQLGYTY